MDSQIIYLKNRFYKLDPLTDPTQNSSDLWADALIYNSENDKWINDQKRSYPHKLILDLNEKKWIRLIKLKGSSSPEFEQQGPYSDHEIFDMLKKSQVSFRDPLWKKGLSRWTPIAKIETFKGLLDIQKQKNDLISTADILDSIIEMRRVENDEVVPQAFIENELPIPEVIIEKFETINYSLDEKISAERIEDGKRTYSREKNSHTIVLRADAKAFPIERLFFALGVTLIFLFFMIKIMF